MSTTDKYMEVVFADDTNPNAIKKPAKGWRNWWRATGPFWHVVYKRDIDPGEIVPGTKVYPSKDVAQTAAPETQAMNIREYGACCIRYLGAFPEGERP